jgi:hypothetical protein
VYLGIAARRDLPQPLVFFRPYGDLVTPDGICYCYDQ